MTYGNKLSDVGGPVAAENLGDLARIAYRVAAATDRAYDAVTRLGVIADNTFGAEVQPDHDAGKDCATMKPPAVHLAHANLERLHEALTALEAQVERFSRL